jgi:hypothetical protein
MGPGARVGALEGRPGRDGGRWCRAATVVRELAGAGRACAGLACCGASVPAAHVGASARPARVAGACAAGGGKWRARWGAGRVAAVARELARGRGRRARVRRRGSPRRGVPGGAPAPRVRRPPAPLCRRGQVWLKRRARAWRVGGAVGLCASRVWRRALACGRRRLPGRIGPKVAALAAYSPARRSGQLSDVHSYMAGEGRKLLLVHGGGRVGNRRPKAEAGWLAGSAEIPAGSPRPDPEAWPGQ